MWGCSFRELYSKCGGLSAARRTVRLSAASVEMTILLLGAKKSNGNGNGKSKSKINGNGNGNGNATARAKAKADPPLREG